ncbi:MAG TPA: two-component regulator propeller domain-containing protein [Anaerolineales bacterium]|nr:two-component regulator propeller domain-containing protein [Anaerolineales bacterium]
MPNTGITQAATNKPVTFLPNTHLRFESLSLEQGLSQSVVNVTYQDSQGYLWFGTQDGLNRYDGYHFTIFRPDPDNPSSLNDRMILDLTEDAHGNLWIGTMLGGLNRYDPQTGSFTHYVHEPDNPDSLGGNCIRTLEIDQDGKLWIGSDGGLDVLDPSAATFLAHYREDAGDSARLLSNSVNDIHQDRSGVMWIATVAGLSYQPSAGASLIDIQHDPSRPESLMGSEVNYIFEDLQGNLWLGTELGLERVDRQTLALEHFKASPNTPGSLSNASVRSILEDQNGNLWIATADGLNLLDRQSGRFTVYRNIPGDPSSLGTSFILSLYQDLEGILWIGTYGAGVSKLDPGHNKFPILQYGEITPKDISSFGLIEDHTGQLWFTMYGQGLLRLNRQTGDYTLYRHDPEDLENSLLDNFVWTVSESRDGMLWIGSNQGLNSLDPLTGQFTHYKNNDDLPDDPYHLNGTAAGYTLEDSQGRLWIAMPSGLDCLDRTTGIFTHYTHVPGDPNSLSKPNVSYVFESQAGEIWLGTYEGGLSRLNPTTGKFTHYQNDPEDPESISSNEVLVIMQDHTGIMWLGTSEGLNKFDPLSGKTKHFTVKDGLPNDVIYGIVEDEQGFLWLSTNYGLSRFDPRTGSTHNYDYNDGLQSDEFNTYAFTKTRQGEIIFAGIRGANIFRPEEILGNQYVPPIVLTRLAQGGEPVHFAQTADAPVSITLRWPLNYFEFEFAALSYSNPDKNQYAYTLEKFDQGWVDNGTYNYGRYTNLPGGSYTLRIKGSNNDGLWNDTGTALSLTIVPPFWQTWWFRAGAIVLVIGAAFAIYRLRVRSIEGYNRHLERQVEERTREIESLFEKTKELAVVEERNRLARDLHDSAKQKAFAALAQLGAVRSMMAHETSSAKSHLDEVEDLVYEVIQELTFLIQEMYPLALKEKGLITILREYLYEWENRNDIRVNLVVNQERRLPLEIEQALYRIAQESLANIARHSHATLVNINLGFNGKMVDMALEDNGCGFNLDQKLAGVGLRTMRERAILIGGSVEISSSPGKGTKISVAVPIHPNEMSNTHSNDNGGQNGPSNNHSDRG